MFTHSNYENRCSKKYSYLSSLKKCVSISSPMFSLWLPSSHEPTTWTKGGSRNQQFAIKTWFNSQKSISPYLLHQTERKHVVFNDLFSVAVLRSIWGLKPALTSLKTNMLCICLCEKWKHHFNSVLMVPKSHYIEMPIVSPNSLWEIKNH